MHGKFFKGITASLIVILFSGLATTLFTFASDIATLKAESSANTQAHGRFYKMFEKIDDKMTTLRQGQRKILEKILER